MPRCSVILPVYNGNPFLGEAIQSVLNQSFVDFELIIIDDGSTDNSTQVIKTYTQKETRILSVLRDHRGLSASLNEAIDRTSGEFIARLDDDDIWLPDKLERQIEYLIQNPDIKLLGSSVSFINEQGYEIGGMQGFNKNEGLSGEYLLTKMKRNNMFCSSSVIFVKSIVDSIGGFNSDYSTSMDYDFALRILSGFKGAILESTLVKYRIHNRMMTIHQRSRMIFESIKIRLRIDRYLHITFWQCVIVNQTLNLLKLLLSFLRGKESDSILLCLRLNMVFD